MPFSSEQVKYCKIFPPIGISRLGNSDKEYFIGPEHPDQLAIPHDGQFKDSAGRIKRQAARFRVYAFDEHHNVLGEVTAHIPTIDEKLAIIEWHVELANKKASWHRFEGSQRVANILRYGASSVSGLAADTVGRSGGAAAAERVEAIDRHERRRRGRSTSPLDSTADDREASVVAEVPFATRDLDSEDKDIPLRRNLSVTGDQRHGLNITPAAQKITGIDQPPVEFRGEFSFKNSTEKVYLGELQTDEGGRLLVLGGRGISSSTEEENDLRHYANNDGWYDDISDGPIMATVRIGGKPIEVRGSAHVIVAPPHYSPATKSVVTLYDEMLQTLIDNPQVPWPHEFGVQPSLDQPISFTSDIYPILNRLSLYQWVSEKAYRGHRSGSGKRGDTGLDLMKRLSSSDAAREPASLQKHIFSRVRIPVKHALLSAEYKGERLESGDHLAKVQANLHYMPPLAGDEGEEISPGDAKTWLSVTPLQYEYLKRWKEGEFVDDWKEAPRASSLEDESVKDQPFILTKAALQGAQGGAYLPGIEVTSITREKAFYSEAFRPDIDRYKAGDITKWMALPWQADFYECSSHWWPTVRPDEVVPIYEFEKIAASCAAGSFSSGMLSIRKPWVRGVGKQRVIEPNIPNPNRGESLQSYRGRVVDRMKAYANAFLAEVFAFDGSLYPANPTSVEEEDIEEYIKTVKDYIKYNISETSYFLPPDPNDDENLFEYYQRLKQVLREEYLYTVINTAIPAVLADDTADISEYAARVTKAIAISSHCHGLIDFEWRVRYEHVGKNDFVKRWSEMGIVVPKQRDGETVYVESGRGKYDLLNWRDYFYIMMNEVDYPDFAPKAKEIAREYFKQGRELAETFRSDPDRSQYAPFEYSWEVLEARMKRIYEINQANAEADVRRADPLFNSRARIKERILQLAPFNQTDGAWLRNITQPGTVAHVRALLAEIWLDEIGGGDPSANHGNIYTTLLQSVGIYLPPVNSREYADNPDIWDESYQIAVRQYCISKFTDEYLPEILGMTLNLEWESNYLPVMIKIYSDFGYDPHFYKLHLAIDNATTGHGAKALQAIKLYLEQNPANMQGLWQRIWDGYICFGMVGDNHWKYKLTHPSTVEERMLEMVARKKPFSQLNHGDKKLGENTLNQWPDDPEGFLKALQESRFITPGNAAESLIMRLMTTQGPMYKVFTPAEVQLWRDWINSLNVAPIARPAAREIIPPDQAFAELLKKLHLSTVAADGHTRYQLEGPNPDQSGLVRVTKPLTWWFSQRDPKWVMQALKEAKEWVIPGNVAESRLMKAFVQTDRAMGRALGEEIPEIGHKTGKQIISEWIEAGCPLFEEQSRTPTAANAIQSLQGYRLFTAALSASRPGERELLGRTRPSEPMAATDREAIRRRFYGPGGGAVH